MFYHAKPIWIKDKNREMNVFAVFRLQTTLKETANLHITGATFYRVFVNGAFIGFGPARAAAGYAREDILPIKSCHGMCEIVIEVCGYYCKCLSTVLQPSFLMAELRCADKVLAYTGRDFEGFLPECKIQKVERYSKQRHFTEIWDYRKGNVNTSDKYRAELEILDNLAITVLDRRAPYALYEDVYRSVARTRGKLEFDPTLPFRKEKYSDGHLPKNWGFWEYDDIEYHPHTWIQRQKQRITEHDVKLPLELKAGEYAILDFCKIEAGFLAFEANAMYESDVVIAFTEYYNGETFELPNMNAHNVLEYFLPQGFKGNSLSFEPYTCRFAIVAVKEGHIRLNSFGIKTFMFDTRNIELPDYKNETLNTIYRAAVRTFAHNAVDLYTDCPSRERAGWLCDTYFTAKTEYALTGKTLVEDAFLENYRLYKDTGELLPGTLPMCYPADMFIHPTDIDIYRFIPQWTMWYIIEAAEYVLKRGHKDMVGEFKESIYKLLDFYRQYENEDGLLECLPSWNFVEWSKANDWTKDVNYPTNFLYAQVLECIGELYDDEICRRRCKEVRLAAVAQSFNGTYFMDHACRDESGKLVLQNHSSEACQYYAILFGGIDISDEKFQPLYHLITEVFAPNRGDAMPEIMEVNAFIGAYLRLEALLKMEEYELLLKDVVGFFGNMGQYTETLWENRQYKGSCDHGFASYALVVIEEAMKGQCKKQLKESKNMNDKISGKLIITSYIHEKSRKNHKSHQVACFVANNRPEYVKVIPEENSLPAGTMVTGKVTNIVQNIPAAFVALNSKKDMGFLALNGLEQAVVTNRNFQGKLQVGDEILVKIEREPMKTKEATLSTSLDMTARYAVAHLGSGRLLFSKKLSEKDKEIILAYLVSKAIATRDKQLIGMSDVDITVRTDAGKLLQRLEDEKNLSLSALVQDIHTSVSALRQLITQASMRTCYTVHQKPVTWLHEVWHELTLCGYAIEEYVTDDFDIYENLKELVQAKEAYKIRFYEDSKIPLATLYSIQSRMDELMQTKVWLPSGGYLCIEPTEAMVVVDINTGKAIRKAENEQLFFDVNKEAAFEIARQLRLRNLSGMVIIDFINMKEKAKERELLEYMKQCVKNDFSKVTVYDFTRLGLLEVTRNKKSKALYEFF